ncbi:MAG: aconitate hydratase AcnA [Sulfolobales archaeon]
MLGYDRRRFLRELYIDGVTYRYYSLKALSEAGFDRINRLPLSLRIILESLLRNYDGKTVAWEDLEHVINWSKNPTEIREIPFKVARVIMQDFTGVPAILDLAAMRDVAKDLNMDPSIINPLVPVDLIIDHSIQVDYWGSADALRLNIKAEMERNIERYRFLKWAQNAFKNLKVYPPGIGIIHQINLEYIAKVVMASESEEGLVAYFDTVIGTDSHTTMINGLGVLGWGVGGIEAEAAMLGEPVIVPTPEVFGVQVYGELRPGVTATDIVLHVTELLRRHGVVGRFVEFFGESVKHLDVPTRATIANMAPEYGSTTALFPVDEETIRYLRMTGRSEHQIKLVKAYFEAQGMFGIPGENDVEYTKVIDLDLSEIEPIVSGPTLPWQKRRLSEVRESFLKLVEERNKKRGLPASAIISRQIKLDGALHEIRDGDILIAAITSCTNTSNPEVMIGAGILARKAVERGLKVPKHVKTSLAPGSRVVTEYLSRSGLLEYLEKLGFYVVGYGCTTCIGNSGPLPEDISKALSEGDLLGVSVLSGNRNFESRVHPDIRANYLMSPILVVAYAIAGNIMKDLSKEPLGVDPSGKHVYLKDIWPSREEIIEFMNKYISREIFEEKYSRINEEAPEEWKKLEAPLGETYEWDEKSTYIRKPPFFDDFKLEEVPGIKDIKGARILLLLGDSITTDHISPAGAIDPKSPAGQYLISKGVKVSEFNTYGARRGNHEVMVRGTFASKSLRNLLLADRNILGGYTLYAPTGEIMSVYDASVRYSERGVPLLVIAGENYGAGSSRDWAAKGPKLLGVKVVIAKSFERIHRSNLVGMGIIPLQFLEGEGFEDLRLDGSEEIDIIGLENAKPRDIVRMIVKKPNGEIIEKKLLLRIDTETEMEYVRNGGILPYVLRKILKRVQK